jgi:flagellar M-ring protein FliF
MREIFKQLVTIWSQMQSLQKGGVIVMLFTVAMGLSFLLFGSSAVHYTPLFLTQKLTLSEQKEIKTYFEQLSIPYREDREKGLAVHSKYVDQACAILLTVGLPKQEEHKGFELFDTNTWIKGEKELQVLEMRALKGQLERDLTAYESIKNATVILDIPPQRGLNGPNYKTKASVILTLMPKSHLSESQLRAITNHLAGAVRGLEPEMIAISDTSGKLYKAFDEGGKQEAAFAVSHCLEERLHEKIALLLASLVGEDNFYATVQIVMERDKEPASCSLTVMMNASTLINQNQKTFCKEIAHQLTAIAQGYGLTVTPIIDFIPFKEIEPPEHKVEQQRSNITPLFFIFISVLLLILATLLTHQLKKRRKEPNVHQAMTQVDTKTLADSLQNEDPQTIALMLSYLEPNRAEQMIVALKQDLQTKVLFHLSEWEQQNRSNV